MNSERFLTDCISIGLQLSDEQFELFQAFEEALYKANEVMNLTRVARDEGYLRHFVDSLLFQKLVPHGARVLDIGTGPGFPAWPLACARPDLQVTAIDSSGKMIGFLQKHLLPNLKSVQVRAEEWSPGIQFDVVTGRAVAPLATQLELSAPHVRQGGLIIPMRTANDPQAPAQALNELGLELVEEFPAILPELQVKRLFPIYKRVGKLAAKYPRAWAEMKRRPLF